MFSASVSNVDLFRVWQLDEELDLGWILDRISRKTEQTEPMRVGEALHKALETAPAGEFAWVEAMGYRFQFLADTEIFLPRQRELKLSRHYGELQIRGRVDAINGLVVYDHKSTSQFEPERLMSGYQWRYYLDMANADVFRWNVMVIKETDDPKIYLVIDSHWLSQYRYPELHADCERLAGAYLDFAKEHLVEVPA